MTLYEEIHTVHTKEKYTTHQLFLSQLKSLLPDGCSPVVVTDAGFRMPWFRQIEALGWDWVGQVRNRTFIRLDDDKDWHPCKSTYDKAKPRSKALGAALMTCSNPIACHLILVKAKPKGQMKLTCFGQRAMRHQSEKQAKREREPWLLATSLPNSSTHAKKVVNIYKTRMQIEEAFRAMKSHRYGLGFSDNLSKKIKRLDILLLLGLLAFFVLWCNSQLNKSPGLVDHYMYCYNSPSSLYSGRFVMIKSVSP